MSPARLALLAMVSLAVSAGDGRAEQPSVHYQLHCQGCHLPDGRGSPGAVPSLVGVARFATLPEGRAYLVGVPGSAQAPLSDGELAAVLNWMLAEFGPPELAARVEPFDASEVARCRTPLGDVEERRSALLEVIEARKRDTD